MDQCSTEDYFKQHELMIESNISYYIEILEKDRVNIKEDDSEKGLIPIPLLSLRALQSSFIYLVSKHQEFTDDHIAASARLITMIPEISFIAPARKSYMLVKRDALWVMMTGFFFFYRKNTIKKQVTNKKDENLYKVINLIEIFENSHKKDNWVQAINSTPGGERVMKLVSGIPKEIKIR